MGANLNMFPDPYKSANKATNKYGREHYGAAGAQTANRAFDRNAMLPRRQAEQDMTAQYMTALTQIIGTAAYLKGEKQRRQQDEMLQEGGMFGGYGQVNAAGPGSYAPQSGLEENRNPYNIRMMPFGGIPFGR